MMGLLDSAKKKFAGSHSSNQQRPPSQYPQTPADAPNSQGRPDRQSKNGSSTAATHNTWDGEDGANGDEGQQPYSNQQPTNGGTRVVNRTNTGGQHSSVQMVTQENGMGDPRPELNWVDAERVLLGGQPNASGGEAFSDHQPNHGGAQPGSTNPTATGNLEPGEIDVVQGRVEWLIKQHPAKLRSKDQNKDDQLSRIEYALIQMDFWLREYTKLEVAYVKDTDDYAARLTKSESELQGVIIQLQSARQKQKPIMDTHIARSEFEKLQRNRDQLKDECKSWASANGQLKGTISDQSKVIADQNNSISRLNSENGKLKAKQEDVSGLKTTIKQLTEGNDKLVASRQAWMDGVTERDAIIKRLGTDLEARKGEVAAAAQTHASEMSRLRNDHASEKGLLRQNHETEKVNLKQEHEDKRKSLEQRLATAQGDAEKKRSILVKQHQDEVKKIRSEHGEAIKQETSRLQKKIATMQTDFNEDKVALEKKHKDQLASHEEDAKVYQRALTTSSDTIKSLTDAELRNELTQLRNAVEALSRAPFWEKPGPDMAVLGEISGQSEIVSSIPSKHRKFLLESAIWSVLMKGLFGLPVGLSGIGTTGDDLVQLWAHLFAPGSTVASNGSTIPAPESLGEQWRSITTEALRRNVLGEHAKAEGSSDFRKDYLQNQAGVREQLLQMLGRITTVKKPSDIDSVVERASTMAVLFGTQKARIEMCLPSMGESSSAIGYEVSFSNEADVAKAKNTIVQFGVSPGLRKWGNARGGALETMTCLVPAFVYARPA